MERNAFRSKYEAHTAQVLSLYFLKMNFRGAHLDDMFALISELLLRVHGLERGPDPHLTGVGSSVP